MASIRRTQSPACHDRSHANGGSPFSAAPSALQQHKVISPSSSFSSCSSPAAKFLPLGSISVALRRLVAAVFVPKPPRKGGRSPWRRSAQRFLLFFVIGVLLGLAPISNVDDLRRRRDFSFEVRPPGLPDLAGVGLRNRAIEAEPERIERSGAPGAERGGLNRRYDSEPRKLLIVVTPTYNRPLQAFYLNRLAHTLRLVPPPLLWIVVEANSASAETAEILWLTGVMFRHLVCEKNLTDIKDRGVHQRNTAIEHIERHKLDGIVYFADGDNAYSLELFDQMREIGRFGTWPVAMLSLNKNKAVLEGPVCNGSQVIGWHTNENCKKLRRFHVDMSGFAFNSTILWDPKRWHRFIAGPIRQRDSVKEGFQETTFIEQLVEDESQMEGMPHGCSRVMNWHLNVEARSSIYPRGWSLQNLDAIVLLEQ